MKIEFSGLCVFHGWTGDGEDQPPVKVLLTRSAEESPHQPLLVVRSSAIRTSDNSKPPDPDPADIAFVDPHDHHEMLGWHIQGTLKLPPPQATELNVKGTEFLINLGRLSNLGGGGSTLDPRGTYVAASADITAGRLEAKRIGYEQPNWNYVGCGKEYDGDFSGNGIVIADRVEYDLGVQDPNGLYTIEFGHPTLGQVTLTVKQGSRVIITNVCRFAQFLREVHTSDGRETIEDFAQHYRLFENPPVEACRFVPALNGQSGEDESTSHCVRAMARLEP